MFFRSNESIKAARLVVINFAALLFSAWVGTANAVPVWQNGDLVSYNQASWTTSPSGFATLTNNYFSVYQATFGVVEIGIPGNSGY